MALTLALVLAFGMISSAFALTKTEYDAPDLKNMGINSQEWTSTDDVRVTTAAFMLLEYMIVSGNYTVVGDVASSGYGRIAAYGTCIDLYYLQNDGKYLNIFVAPNSGKITDWGAGPFDGNTDKYTYYYMDMGQVVSRMFELLSSD